MLHRFLCRWGWHVWVNVLLTNRVCVWCGKRQELRFYGPVPTWIDDK